MSKLGLIIIAVVAVLLIGTGTTVALLSGGDATNVEEVADQAVEAAEDLDVDAGIDLLCDAPSAEERDELDAFIETAQDEAGTDDPDVDYAISDVEGEETGSFRVDVSSEDPAFEDQDFAIDVTVEQDGDRSCIAGAEPVE